MSLITTVEGSVALQTNGSQKYFELPAPTPFFRHFMIKQIAANTMGYHNLRLSLVDFFGRFARVT
jgi:hypothetical protein